MVLVQAFIQEQDCHDGCKDGDQVDEHASPAWPDELVSQVPHQRSEHGRYQRHADDGLDCSRIERHRFIDECFNQIKREHHSAARYDDHEQDFSRTQGFRDFSQVDCIERVTQ